MLSSAEPIPTPSSRQTSRRRQVDPKAGKVTQRAVLYARIADRFEIPRAWDVRPLYCSCSVHWSVIMSSRLSRTCLATQINDAKPNVLVPSGLVGGRRGDNVLQLHTSLAPL